MALAEIADALERPGYFCSASIGHARPPSKLERQPISRNERIA
jgi:hypothetical protein